VIRPPEAGEIGPGAGRSTPEAGLPQPKPAGEKEEFTLKGLAPGKYWLAVKSLDAAENISDLSNVAEAEVK
jgi:hypothetical protein